MLKFLLYGFAALFGLGILMMVGFYLFMNVGLQSEWTLFGLDRYRIPEGSPVVSVAERTIARQQFALPDDETQDWLAAHYVTSTGAILSSDISYEERAQHSAGFLIPRDERTGLLFTKNEVYHYADSLSDSLAHTFTDKSIKEITAVAPLDDETVILITKRPDKPHSLDRIWQCRLDNFELSLLQDQAILPSIIMPRKYALSAIGGTAVVTYTELLAWGHGGEVYRPKYNNLHFFSADHPDGVHLIETTFKAGLIRDVRYNQENRSIEVYSDSARPTENDEQREKVAIDQLSLSLKEHQ